MKHKYCRFFLTFASGVITGIAAVNFYQIFGKPVLPCVDPVTYVPEPKVEKHDVTFGFDYERMARAIMDTPVPSRLGNYLDVPGEYDGWAEQFNEPEPEPDKADTQPVRVLPDWLKEW